MRHSPLGHYSRNGRPPEPSAAGLPPTVPPAPPNVAGAASDDPDDGAGLPRSLLADPVVRLSGDLRPRGIRVRLGPVPVVFPPDAFELFAAILAGRPDPDDLEHDYITHDSASPDGCRLRAGVGRLRDRFVAAFAGQPDAGLARNVIRTVWLEKTYVLDPRLTVCADPSVGRLAGHVRPAILDLLLATFPPCAR